MLPSSCTSVSNWTCSGVSARVTVRALGWGSASSGSWPLVVEAPSVSAWAAASSSAAGTGSGGQDEGQAVALCIRSHSSPRDLLPGRNGIAGRLTDDELSAGEGVPNQQGVWRLDHFHHAGRDLRAGGDVRLGDDDRGGGGDRRTGLSVVVAPAALVQGDQHSDGRHQAGYQGKNEQPPVASRNRQPLNPGHW